MGRVRRWSWVLVLLVGGALFELIRRSTVETGNPNLVPALILLGAGVIPTAFVAFIAGRRLVSTSASARCCSPAWSAA